MLREYCRVSGYLISFLFVVTWSCENDPVDIVGFNFRGSTGLFIINEGNYNMDNASLSFYEFSSKRVYNQIFFATNETPLGDIAQSMIIHNNIGYIVINNSGKIYAIDPDDASFLGKITGLVSPRHMLFVSDTKAYISDLYSRKIYIYGTLSDEIIGEIDVNNHNPFNQHSTERLVRYMNLVFAACWSYDNYVLVIDIDNDQIIDSIEVTTQPNSLILDHNNKLWVLSDGGFAGSSFGQEKGALTRIDPESRRIESIIPFTTMNESPFDLQINKSGNTLFFINDGIFKMSVQETDIPSIPFIPESGRNFYSLGINPVNSDIYVGDAIDFQQNGIVYRFNDTGSLIDSFKVGINPGAFCFKP